MSALGTLSEHFQDTFPLTYQAIEATILVSVNGTLVTSGWNYVPSLDAVVFEPASVPDDGDLVEITYSH